MGKEEVTYIPETAHEWLETWDSGEPVASVEMGGLGEHYEQAIQVTAAEALRELLHLDPESLEISMQDWWNENRDTFDQAVSSRLPGYANGRTGAQVGAAYNLAFILYRRGTSAFSDPKVSDRLILVSKGSES